MTCLALEGGTDAASVAIFAVAALQPEPADSETVEALTRREAAIVIGGDGDGDYRMKAWIDEPLPEGIAPHVIPDDAKEGFLDVPDGRIGFGGLESLSSTFEPNANIREDGVVPPGRYAVKASWTAFSDKVYRDALHARIGPWRARLLRLPEVVVPLLAIAAIVTFMLSTWWKALLVPVLGAAALRFGFFGVPAVRRLRLVRREVQREFPSIVVEMRRV